MNCCMHILFQHYISTVSDEYTIHFAGSYKKYDEMVDQKRSIFLGGPILPIPAVQERNFYHTEIKFKKYKKAEGLRGRENVPAAHVTMILKFKL